MERIAFINGGTAIYWSSIILTLAAATAICFFLAFYLGRGGNFAAGFAALPLSLALSLAAARFFHWYSNWDSYDSLFSAMTDYTSGGYALIGVFAGCFLAALILRVVCLHRNLPEMLDCMCLAGGAGIAVGRLASFFNSSDRGQVVQSIQSLPWVYPVTNAVSGAVEYRLATFVLQSMAALTLFLALTAFYVRGGGRSRRKDGDTCLIFLLCYSASQVVLDSTRYDSLFFRSNGFVSVVQVLAAAAMVMVSVVFSVRLVRSRGFHFAYLPLWIGMAAAMGGAGFMEYYVQRHGNEAVFAYSVMSACLGAVVLMALLLRLLAVTARRKKTSIAGSWKRAAVGGRR